MAPFALVLHLALASTEPALQAAPAPAPRLSAITLAPQQLDPGPFQPGELAGATLGAFAGDALVLGSGYLALQLAASGAIAPTATNFRRTAYGVGVGALVVPPLTGVLMAWLVGGPHAPGGFWKAMLLATAGQVAALAAGYALAPRFWVVLPVQAVTLSLGASFGLHWGSRGRVDAVKPPPDEAHGKAPRPGATATLATPLCTDS
jgi:hypothetical protein